MRLYNGIKLISQQGIQNMTKYKVVQVESSDGKTTYLIIDEMDNPEEYLEYGEEIVTDCYLSDVLNCEPEDVSVVPQIMYQTQ